MIVMDFLANFAGTDTSIIIAEERQKYVARGEREQ
jgi:hypothetical protein